MRSECDPIGSVDFRTNYNHQRSIESRNRPSRYSEALFSNARFRFSLPVFLSLVAACLRSFLQNWMTSGDLALSQGAAGAAWGAAMGCVDTISSLYQVCEVGPADTLPLRFVQYASSVIMSKPGEPASWKYVRLFIYNHCL
jgi:hypothetical protein